MTMLDDKALDQLFGNARTHRAWQARPVEDALLDRLWSLTLLAPTALNVHPLRVVFVRTEVGKQRLRDVVAPGNLEKTMTAPVTAVLGVDTAFHKALDPLMPGRGIAERFDAQPEAALKLATENGWLQAGHFIVAARALGLDVGPMGGFDAGRADAAFFEGSATRSLLLCNLGYGEPAQLTPRGPRLPVETTRLFA